MGGDAKGDEVSTMNIQLHPNGKYEKASTLMLSGPRKEVEYVGLVGRDVGIPHEEETGTPVGVPEGGVAQQGA